MRLRTIAAAAATTVIVLTGVFATPVSAQEAGELSVSKLVLGDSPTEEFSFTVECQTVGELIVPSAVSDAFILTDGQTESNDEFDLETDFGEGVPCTVVETALGVPPADAWAIVISGSGELIEVEPSTDVPTGADFAWDFSTIEGEFGQDYNVLVVNDYSTDGTAEALCAVIADQVGVLNDLLDSFGDIEELTPEQLTELWEVETELFTSGLEVAPPEIAQQWENVTVAYILVGDILSGVGFDVDELSSENIDAINAIFDSVSGDFDDIAAFLTASCVEFVPISTTTTTTAAVQPVAQPRFTG